MDMKYVYSAKTPLGEYPYERDFSINDNLTVQSVDDFLNVLKERAQWFINEAKKIYFSTLNEMNDYLNINSGRIVGGYYDKHSDKKLFEYERRFEETKEKTLKEYPYLKSIL